MTLSTPKIVVTGASGFLGSATVAALERRGIAVVAVSRKEGPRIHRVRTYSDSPGGDVLIHLAEDADRARVNLDGASRLDEARETLRRLLAKHFARIIYASSAVLYGDAARQAHTPNDPVEVTDSYAMMKYDSERMVLEAGGGIVARLSNIYGPGMGNATVMERILTQLDQEGPVRLLDASPIRDFLWIEDAAEGLCDLAVSGVESGVFNIGTGIGTSVGELARLALAAAGQRERPVVSTAQAARVSILVIDPSETTRACGWSPRTPVLSGVATLVASRGGGA